MKMKKVCFLFSIVSMSIFSIGPEVSLDQYLTSRNVTATQNSAHIDVQPGRDQQVQYFIALLQKYPNIKKVAEIGFNLGHSSEVFLKTRPDIQVVSCDMMFNWWNFVGKEYIDAKYPGRHQLLVGDSQIKMPEFKRSHPNFTFDCIFIDGGHSYSVALQDIVNMQFLARSDTVLIMDDIEFHEVNDAWKKCISDGLIEELERFPPPNSAWGWAVGRYIKRNRHF
jgi:predicted O-methyltransferase YrrM